MNKKSLISIVFFIIAFILATYLLINEYISGWEYVVLYITSGLFSFGILGFNRLQELDIKNLRIVLSEIREVKEDIYAKEKDLKSISLRLAEILAFTAAFQNRWGSEESIKLKKRWYISKSKSLLQSLEVSPNEKRQVLGILNDFSELDSLDNKEKREQKHKEILRKIEKDIDKTN